MKIIAWQSFSLPAAPCVGAAELGLP